MSTITPNRTVEIYISSSKLRKVITSSATTWGELREELIRTANISSADLDSDNSKIFEGNQRVELVSNETQLPTNIRLEGGATTNNLLIIVTPKTKVKSGSGVASLRNLAYDEIKSFISEDGKVAKEHFGVYPNKPTGFLLAKLSEYKDMKRKAHKSEITKVPVKKDVPVTYNTNISSGVLVSQESIAMLSSGISLIAKGMELIKISGLSNLFVVTADPNIDRLESIANSLQQGR